MDKRKGYYFTNVDYLDMFRRSRTEPLMLDELDTSTEQGRQRINSLVYSRYEGDVFSNVPSCDCGAIKGGARINVMCTQCHTECLPITERPIEPVIWIRAPSPVPAFIHLNIWRLLSIKFTVSGYNLLEHLTDPYYRPPVNIPPGVAELERHGIGSKQRGLTYFHDHFDEIMDIVLSNRKILGKNPGKRQEIEQFIRKFRDVIFTPVLPFPSKIGFIVEDVGDRTYVDPQMNPIMDALNTLINIRKDNPNPSRALVESRVIRATVKACQFYRGHEQDKVFGKPGVMRKLVYGTSPHMTWRTVITSQHRPHLYDQLSLPWGASVLLFKMHLANKLLKENFTPNNILSLIYRNTLRTNPLIEKMLDELIEESPDPRGIPSVFTRFPSLKRGSSQRFFIGEIKKDPNLLSTSISVMCLRAPNKVS